MTFLKSREVQIGILMLFIISLSIWGFNFLKGKNVFGSGSYYYCTFDNVGGLMESNFVVVQGFKVGLVEEIKLEANSSENVICVRIILENDLKLSKDTKAILVNQDLLGTKAVNLVLGKGDEYFEKGDTLPSSVEAGMLSAIKEDVSPVVDNVQIIMQRIDSVLQAVQKTLSADNITSIKNTIANLESTTNRINGLLKNKEAAIASIVSNLDSISQSLNSEKESIAATLLNVKTISDSLALIDYKALVLKIDGTLESFSDITRKINESEGSLGLLVNDSALYDNLSDATKSLDNLLIDLKRKPARYAHLSLIDWGKDVYIDDEGEALKIDDKLQLKFGALVKLSEMPLEINANNFVDYKQVNERKRKGKYYYFYGFYSDYHACKTDIVNIRKNYPNAEIIGLDSKKIYFFE